MGWENLRVEIHLTIHSILHGMEGLASHTHDCTSTCRTTPPLESLLSNHWVAFLDQKELVSHVAWNI